MRTATRALAKGGWTEQFNQGWRFSPLKTGSWPILAQIGMAILFLWRLKPTPAMLPLMLPSATVLIQGLFGAFVVGLLRGRVQLYGKTVLRALHASPASGGSILAGLALAGLPERAAGSLCVAAVVALRLPAGALWWSMPLLWALALLSSLIGYAAALLTLVGWVRVAPRSLAVMWAIAMALAFGLANCLIYLLMRGGSLSVSAAGLQVVAPWLITIVGAFVGLPGVAMGIWVALRPGRAGEWYREAYLKMQELGDGRRGMRRSRWPRLLPGPAGALQARQWREIWLNWFTWVRLGAMLLLLGSLAWSPAPLIRMAERLPVVVVMGFGLTAALGALGELAGPIGGSDGPNIGLGMVAGVRAGQVVLAKWLAAAPLALLSAACTWVAGVVAQHTDLSLTLAAGCIGLGFGVIALGGGLCDLDPHAEVTEREVPELLRAMLAQAPGKLGAVIGYAAALLFSVVAVWLCQRWPDALLPLAIGLAALSHLGLVPGYVRLRGLGM